MNCNYIPSGEVSIIKSALSISGHCGAFVAMCNDNLFHGVQYDPATATRLLAAVLGEIVSACKALGIEFGAVVAESTRQSNPPTIPAKGWRAD